jgi:hypothetical protein
LKSEQILNFEQNSELNKKDSKKKKKEKNGKKKKKADICFKNRTIYPAQSPKIKANACADGRAARGDRAALSGV